MSEAGVLTQSRSIGLIDDAAVTFSNSSVDLKGMFPQRPVDTAITEQLGSVKASSREFSRRNLDISLGNPVSATAPVDVKTTLATGADVAANATSITVASATGFAVDDVIVIYPEGRPQDVTISQIQAIASNVITLKTGLGTVVGYPAATESGTQFHVFKGHGVAAGNVTKTNYFTMSIIKQKNITGRPIVWLIWKASNSGSMEESNTATDYGTLPMEFKILAPSLADVGVSGPLNHVASMVNAFPSGVRIGGADQ
jgi:hypothetical protein